MEPSTLLIISKQLMYPNLCRYWSEENNELKPIKWTETEIRNCMKFEAEIETGFNIPHTKGMWLFDIDSISKNFQ